MKLPHACFLPILLYAVSAWNGNSAENPLHPWEMLEISMEAEREFSSPYVEGLPDNQPPFVKVLFKALEGPATGTNLALNAFWDGARLWKVRFAPPAPGTWQWSALSADKQINGRTGVIDVVEWTEEEKQANPARRGFVQVAKVGNRAGRYFEYSDGTPFLWIGDTWWNWTKKGILFSSFQKLADDRAGKGFTIGQLYFAGNGGLLNRALDMPDLPQIRKVEEMIAYANRKGITVWIHPWWSREGMSQRVTEAQMRRWWRYVVARLGAYNVIWVLAGEYNMNNYAGYGLPFWKTLGALVKAEDPYQRILSAHPTPPAWDGGAGAPQWSTGEVLHQEPWLDYNQSQVGHGRWRNEMIPTVIAADYARKPAKPNIVTEPWYEFTEGSPTAMEIRNGAWTAILSGAAGHSYGGGHVWWAHLPESPTSQGPWPLDKSFDKNTLDYPGARSISFLAQFLKGIPWWKLEPHPELLSDYPAPFCAADPGNLYVAYLRFGGAVKVDLRAATTIDAFEYTWIDLEEMKERSTGKVPGGALREFHAPEDYPGKLQFKDWLLYIKKQQSSPSPTRLPQGSRS